MICPYNRKSETQVLQWTQSQNPDEEKSGQQITRSIFHMMDCPKEGCGAWTNGKCQYAAVSVENE